MAKPDTLKVQLFNLQQELERTKHHHYDQVQENDKLKARINLIAAENETLRQDKKWYQQMLSGMIQTTLAKVS